MIKLHYKKDYSWNFHY